MKRVLYLFVMSLSGCLLVASLLSSCTGIHRPTSLPSAEAPQSDTLELTEPLSPSRVQIGVASWYGKEFHGRPTASGEIYDMYQPTAAHRTAPLGTYALVTNLNNGQSVRVRINDRGPYKGRRLLDLSYGAARQIEMVQPGLTQVKIEFLAESIPLTASVPLSKPAVIPVDTSLEQRNSIEVFEILGMQSFAVQGGAYQDQSNAIRAQKTLTTVYPHVWITMAPESTQPLHRVRLGPFQNRDEAERVAQKVKARGYVPMIVAMARQAQNE
jgi:rare lipoprotein A